MTRRISIFGLSYVGLCTAIGFTNKGYYVIAVDKDIEKIASISRVILPFHACIRKNIVVSSISKQ